MNLYLVSRYGAGIFLDELNPDLETTKDSNLLVRAKTFGRAGELAHDFLAAYISSFEHLQDELKTSRMLCDYIVQIGTDAENPTEEVIHGPFLSHAIIRGKHAGEIAKGINPFKSWTYDRAAGTWRKVRHS
ncbi:MAG: hypothetical protein ACX94D_04440 [Henriciella sp.]